MSFIVNDPVFEYVAPILECPACFGAGKTPNILIFAMGDILKGDDWIAADPPPPNGIWLVPVNVACNWNTTITPWILDWTSAPGVSASFPAQMTKLTSESNLSTLNTEKRLHTPPLTRL